MTSHDVVDRVRRTLGERRVGHSGTLDPDATGVLLVGVGVVTRVLRFLTDLPKTYTADVVLGIETSTLDASGEVTARHDMDPVAIERVRDVIAEHLTGPIMQVPPMVSALKVDGRRLHELAREGIEVDRKSRPVVVHRFAADSSDDDGVIRIEVECSSGTYVRTLAADLGKFLGGGAHLRDLRRTAIGSFVEADTRPLDSLELLDAATALRDYRRIDVDSTHAALVAHGSVLDGAMFDGVGPWAVVGPDGRLLAIYEAFGERAKPAVVLAW